MTRSQACAALPVLALWLLLCALAAPLNHDESQYVAGAVLAARGMPFRDFMALQPPLALWVWAPLTIAFSGWSFLAIRMSSALFGLVTVCAVADAEKRLLPEARWPVGATLLVFCDAFLFTSSIARNDALPAMLLAIGMAAGLRGIKGRAPWLGLAGLSLGLAGATKLSFLPSLAGAGIGLLLMRRHIGTDRIALFAACALAGLTPLFAGWSIAPEAFLFGVFRFGVEGPVDWYTQIGHPVDLALWRRLVDSTAMLSMGPAMAALVIVGASWRCWSSRAPDRLFVIALVVSGLIGALLPAPSHIQYLMTLLPPLFALLALAIRHVSRPLAARWILAGFALVGAGPSLRALYDGFPALQLEHQAHAIGAMTAMAGTIATLSPDRVVDSGHPLDRRFAAGPFIFRSSGILSARDAGKFGVAVPETLGSMFAADPPAAILVGYEPWKHKARPDVDMPLENWAIAHRYAIRRLPDGQGRLYEAPAAIAGRP